MQLSEIGLCENLHAVNDFNSLSQVIQESANINTFKRHVFIIIYYYYFNNFSLYILISFIWILCNSVCISKNVPTDFNTSICVTGACFFFGKEGVEIS